MMRGAPMLAASVLLTSLALGCTFDTVGPSTLSPAPGNDAPSIAFSDGAIDSPEGVPADSGREDVVADTRSADGSRDALSPDVSLDTVSSDTSVDTLSPDATVDTFAHPDGWISDAVVASCATLFGSATTYELCSADATSCTFAFNRGELSRSSCHTLCNGSCVEAHDNLAGTTCTAEAEPGCSFDGAPADCSCTTSFISGICSCSR